jgi:hypothetical protein
MRVPTVAPPPEEIAAALTNAERASGSARREQLNRLAAQLNRDASGAADAAYSRPIPLP